MKEGFKANTILIRKEISNFALLQKGKEYIHDHYGPDTFDCAGFVWYVYDNVLGIDVFKNGVGKSTTTKIMTGNKDLLTIYDENSFNKDLKLIKEGDILLFHRQSIECNEPSSDNKYPGHCGIYLGNNKFIHCSRPKKKVIISSLDNEKWYRLLVGKVDIITSYVPQKRLKMVR